MEKFRTAREAYSMDVVGSYEAGPLDIRVFDWLVMWFDLDRRLVPLAEVFEHFSESAAHEIWEALFHILAAGDVRYDFHSKTLGLKLHERVEKWVVRNDA